MTQISFIRSLFANYELGVEEGRNEGREGKGDGDNFARSPRSRSLLLYPFGGCGLSVQSLRPSLRRRLVPTVE